MPKISVIIPTYNSADFLPEAIESVLAQTYKDFEIVVIDDGSTDNTKETVTPYLDKITFFEISNGGPSKARNHGIRNSSGDYVAFLDADDIWYPDKLDRQMTLFSEYQQFSLVHSDASLTRTIPPKGGRTWFSLKKRVNAGWIFSDLLSECFIILSSVMVKRDCLERVGLFDERLKYWEGYDLWLRIAFESQIGLMIEPLFFRRIHERNLFYSEPLKNILSLITVMKKWENKALDLAGIDRKTVNYRLKAGYRQLAVFYLAQGQSARAREALKCSYKRGLSLKGLACFGLSLLPPLVHQQIVETKKRIYRRRTKPKALDQQPFNVSKNKRL